MTVDVALIGPLPPGSRPDLSVDGTIQFEKLEDVVFVGRPVFGQENSTVTFFKLEPDGKYANKVKVTFGRSSVNTIEIKDGLEGGRPRDSLGHVAIRSVRPNQIELKYFLRT